MKGGEGEVDFFPINNMCSLLIVTWTTLAKDNELAIFVRFKEKVYSTPLTMGVVYITPSTMKRSDLPPELSKTVYFTLQAVFSGGFADKIFQRRFCRQNHLLITDKIRFSN